MFGNQILSVFKYHVLMLKEYVYWNEKLSCFFLFGVLLE